MPVCAGSSPFPTSFIAKQGIIRNNPNLLKGFAMSETAQSYGVRTYSGQGYNWKYLARKHRITKEQAQQLIRKVGQDRDKLNAAAQALKSAAG
jgi:hypothetical protein